MFVCAKKDMCWTLATDAYPRKTVRKNCHADVVVRVKIKSMKTGDASRHAMKEPVNIWTNDISDGALCLADTVVIAQ